MMVNEIGLPRTTPTLYCCPDEGAGSGIARGKASYVADLV